MNNRCSSQAGIIIAVSGNMSLDESGGKKPTANANDHHVMSGKVDAFIDLLEQKAIAQFVDECGKYSEDCSGGSERLFLRNTEMQLMSTINQSLFEENLDLVEMQYAYNRIQETVSNKRREWEAKRVDDVQGFDVKVVSVKDEKGNLVDVIQNCDESKSMGVCGVEDGDKKPASKPDGEANGDTFAGDDVVVKWGLTQEADSFLLAQDDSKMYSSSSSGCESGASACLLSASRNKRQRSLEECGQQWASARKQVKLSPEPAQAMPFDGASGFGWKCGICFHKHKYYMPTCSDCGWPRNELFK